jgi:hypothetical protein
MDALDNLLACMSGAWQPMNWFLSISLRMHLHISNPSVGGAAGGRMGAWFTLGTVRFSFCNKKGRRGVAVDGG